MELHMRTWLILGGVIVLLLAAFAGTLSADDLPRLYVVNSLSDDMTIIDPRAQTITGVIPLGMCGYDIAVDGQTAYVTSAPMPEGKAAPGLLVIDLAAQRLRDIIPLALSPLATVHLRANGRQAVVVTAAPPGQRNDARGQVLFIDLPAKNVARTVNVGLNPLASAMTPDGTRLYTADWASHTLSVVDLTAGRLQDTIPIGLPTARVLAMRPDGKKLYTLLERLPVAAQAQQTFNMNAATTQANVREQVQTMGETPLWEIDTTSNAVTRHPFTGVSQALAAAVSPDNRRLYLYGRDDSAAPKTAEAGYALVSVELATMTLGKHYGDFGFLSALLVSGDGKKLYLVGTPGDPKVEAGARRNYNMRSEKLRPDSPQQVAETMQDLSQVRKTVTILDADTGKVEKVHTVGSFPRGAALRER